MLLTSVRLDCVGRTRGDKGHAARCNTNNTEVTDAHGVDYVAVEYHDALV